MYQITRTIELENGNEAEIILNFRSRNEYVLDSHEIIAHDGSITFDEDRALKETDLCTSEEWATAIADYECRIQDAMADEALENRRAERFGDE